MSKEQDKAISGHWGERIPEERKPYLLKIEKIIDEIEAGTNIDDNLKKLKRGLNLDPNSSHRDKESPILYNQGIGICSPINFALKAGKVKAAIKMVKAGYSLYPNEAKDYKEAIQKSNNIINRFFKKITNNDKLRMVIMSSASEDMETKITLANKPSPLYLAMETGQTDLAAELIRQGYALKKSELSKYAKELNIKQGFFEEKLGYYTANRVKELGNVITLVQKVKKTVNDEVTKSLNPPTKSVGRSQ